MILGICGTQDYFDSPVDKIHQKLKTYFNLNVSRSTTHRAMKEVGFSYITPRKSHYKQDKKAAEEFKKKSSK